VCQGWLKQLRNLEQLCTSFCGQEETVQQPNSRETFSLNVNWESNMTIWINRTDQTKNMLKINSSQQIAWTIS
jgi:hypothetical protein